MINQFESPLLLVGDKPGRGETGSLHCSSDYIVNLRLRNDLQYTYMHVNECISVIVCTTSVYYYTHQAVLTEGGGSQRSELGLTDLAIAVIIIYLK